MTKTLISSLLRRGQAAPPDAGVIWRYGMAALAVLVALLVRLSLFPELGENAPYVPFVAAVMFAARFGGVMHTEFGHSILQAVLSDVLGFFGGDALGVSQAWIIVPAIVIFGCAAFSEMDRRQPASPVNLFLLMLAAAALINPLFHPFSMKL